MQLFGGAVFATALALACAVRPGKVEAPASGTPDDVAEKVLRSLARVVAAWPADREGDLEPLAALPGGGGGGVGGASSLIDLRHTRVIGRQGEVPEATAGQQQHTAEPAAGRDGAARTAIARAWRMWLDDKGAADAASGKVEPLNRAALEARSNEVFDNMKASCKDSPTTQEPLTSKDTLAMLRKCVHGIKSYIDVTKSLQQQSYTANRRHKDEVDSVVAHLAELENYVLALNAFDKDHTQAKDDLLKISGALENHISSLFGAKR